jgi:hypothetical protein
MITVIAIDALEFDLVERFNSTHLKQKFYGKTDISEFSEPRTMVLWSSFMTGKNMESEVLAKGDKEMWNIRIEHDNTFFSNFSKPCIIDWNIRIEHDNTFFSNFSKPCIIDLPGYNYDLNQHNQERKLLKAFFDSDDDSKDDIRKKYNELAFEHHRGVKKSFLDSLSKDHDFILGYFSLADVIGHLNFGNRMMMKMIYRELDEIVAQAEGKLIVLSDHGMKAIGQFGDHSGYGFWSNNFCKLGTPKITDFTNIITSEISV